MSRARSIIETLASLIPGYRGYSDKESRRDSDRALRQAIANTIDATKAAVDEAIAECSRSMEFARLEPLERLRRRLLAVSDAIRHAPSGYAGLLDTAPVGAAEIDRLHEYDSALRDHAEKVAAEVRVIAGGGEAATLEGLLSELEEDVRRRDELLKGGH